MRKITLFMVTSVEGYFEGPDNDISWHMVDDEFNDFAIKQINEFDALMFGRKTYDLMYSYWPSAIADESLSTEDHQIGKMMDEIPKFVVSRTMEEADWHGTTLIKDDVSAEIQKLKDQPGKGIAIFGSNNLCVSLMKDGLIDEFRIMTCPIAIGNGNSLFTGLGKKQALKRTATREFGNGNILLTYAKS